jgi:PIN domain
MYLFIDTNVYLSFYHYSNDDLDELHKLSALVERNEIQLLLPRQIIDEFWRNHEFKLQEAISKFKSSKLDNQFPQICKSYDEYEQMKHAIKEYEQAKSSLMCKLQKDIDDEKLKADQVIQELFNAATVVERTDEIVAAARLRYDVGNPPGKDGSYGDAISWESLLSEIRDSNDLCIVSDDKDFKSKSNASKLSPFLRREWVDLGKGNLFFYERLSLFFKDKFPTIHLALEADKELLIKSLLESRSFSATHTIVAKLAKYSEFSAAQANDVLTASLENLQIRLIIGDDDVAQLLKEIIKSHKSQLDSIKLQQVLESLEIENNPDEVAV